MGSRGARYSGDLLTAEGDIRRQTAQDLGLQALAVQERLNNARLQELGLTSAGMLGVGRGRADIEEAGLRRDFEAREAARRAREGLTEGERERALRAALDRSSKAGAAYTGAAGLAWQQYMMDRLPPEILEALFGYATSFNPPGSVVR